MLIASNTAKPTAANGSARPIIPKTLVVPNTLFAEFADTEPDRKFVLGKSFKDTQTGLRGLSREFMKKCLAIKSNRFEFETEQLALSANEHNKINITNDK